TTRGRTRRAGSTSRRSSGTSTRRCASRARRSSAPSFPSFPSTPSTRPSRSGTPSTTASARPSTPRTSTPRSGPCATCTRASFTSTRRRSGRRLTSPSAAPRTRGTATARPASRPSTCSRSGSRSTSTSAATCSAPRSTRRWATRYNSLKGPHLDRGPMTNPPLDERSREVLKSIIQLHVSTGEPVGSESLARALGRTLSSATLRNIMAELEKKGYLDHPHTSAGRQPTDEGYRVYVDSLMSLAPLPARDAAAIDSELRTLEGSPTQVMETATHLLSRHSGKVGFVLVPDVSRATLRRVDLVRLPYPRILVVMVSLTGLVTNRIIEVEEELTQEDLQACANYLSSEFSGLGLDAIRARLLVLMQQEKALYDSLLKNVVSVGGRAFSEDGEADLYLEGTSKLLVAPELNDIARMRALFKAFEEKGRLVKIINTCLSKDGLRITIGHENPDPDLRQVALVTVNVTAAP